MMTGGRWRSVDLNKRFNENINPTSPISSWQLLISLHRATMNFQFKKEVLFLKKDLPL